MENPIQMDDLGVPLFSETPIFYPTNCRMIFWSHNFITSIVLELKTFMVPWVLCMITWRSSAWKMAPKKAQLEFGNGYHWVLLFVIEIYFYHLKHPGPPAEKVSGPKKYTSNIPKTPSQEIGGCLGYSLFGLQNPSFSNIPKSESHPENKSNGQLILGLQP